MLLLLQGICMHAVMGGVRQYLSRDANVVQLFGAYIEGQDAALVSEFMEVRRGQHSYQSRLAWMDQPDQTGVHKCVANSACGKARARQYQAVPAMHCHLDYNEPFCHSPRQ